ncbi:MAG: radical SAM/Cys-rich domain protein [Candidatus Hydrogenedentota bacterium]|nr:MAG: radical SAM/Cys-rich domain protein [Candidatus Hydrogenedentota bacterium]
MTTQEQWNILENYEPAFPERLKASSLKTLQMNITYRCNQACSHCHVDASPTRTEMMDLETMEACLRLIQNSNIETVDITGGAPEMHPHFRYLVEECRKVGAHVIDRCNLTILEEEGYEDLAEFLAKNQVEIVASLPHYSAFTTDKQRGKGVFEKSIRALQKLNQLGYGDTLPLNLVYNPNGLFLSPPQEELEKDFKKELHEKYGITFHHLFAINNIPVNRFLAALVRTGRFETYMETLVQAFNPATMDGLMCRHQVSVRYDGSLYDCDFNQMLDRPCNIAQNIRDLDLETFVNRDIVVSAHCYGCTAGAGSSCGGEIVTKQAV